MAMAVATSCSSTGTETTAGTPTSTAAVTTPDTGTAAPGTTEPPVTTTTPPSPEAVAANLTASDLGAGWADYPEGAPVFGEGDGEDVDCPNASGLLDDLPAGATADGAIIQYGDRLVFAQTGSYVFATAVDAQAFAAYVLSDEYIECRRAELEFGLPVTDPPLAITSTGTNTGDGTTPYVGSFFYETMQIVDGTPQPAGAVSGHSIYVVGSTVIDLFSQFGYSDGDPADLNESTNTMVTAGIDVVLGRVEG